MQNQGPVGEDHRPLSLLDRPVNVVLLVIIEKILSLSDQTQEYRPALFIKLYLAARDEMV